MGGVASAGAQARRQPVAACQGRRGRGGRSGPPVTKPTRPWGCAASHSASGGAAGRLRASGGIARAVQQAAQTLQLCGPLWPL